MKKFTAHYACRAADLNSRLVVATTNVLIFQISNLLMQSWKVRLTCLECKQDLKYRLFFWGNIKLQKNCNQSRSLKRIKIGGLVKVTLGVVHSSYSLPDWQAVKLTFFAPCGGALSYMAQTGGCRKQGMAFRVSSFKWGISDLC